MVQSCNQQSNKLFIASYLQFDIFEFELLFVENMRFPFSGKFPCCNISVLVIITQSLAVGCLVLLPEMGTTRLFPVESIERIEETHFTAMKTRVRLSQPDDAWRQSRILRAQATGS